jgi:hypothetical protein
MKYLFKNMKNISELIRAINRRPKMFIPDLKIDQLYFYISGFLLAKKTNELLENIDISFCEEFNSWLAHKINYKNDYSNWWYMIEDSSYEDKFSTIMGFFNRMDIRKRKPN